MEEILEEKRPLRIAQITNGIESVPPKKYGGTERVISALSEELVKRGHDVTLFASGDSITSAKLISVYPKPLREAKLGDLYGANALTMLNIGLAYQMQDQFDIIHDHCGVHSLATANLAHVPVIHTMHSQFTKENRRIFETLTNPYIVTISEAQAKQTPSLQINHLGTIYHGLPMADYPFSVTDDGYLLFVGRISIEKGVHLAIETAEYLNLPLIIAAKLDETHNIQYFKKYIKPKLSQKIRWIGEVDEEQRNVLMSKALCLLHAVTWPEPFGLTMIEAMACGCPVIAMNKGSIPEVVNHGNTGFVVENVKEMINAVKSIKNIDRGTCRAYALKYFSAEKMTDKYEHFYYKLLQSDFRDQNKSSYIQNVSQSERYLRIRD